MQFLFPIFAIVGAVAAAIPVALHMLRRAPTKDMPFSLVRFLKPSQPKMTKRSRIEHWPLMLLRIIAILIIGAAFGRPYWEAIIPLDDREGSGESVTILLDSSASMGRTGIIEQIPDLVRDVASELDSGDQLTIVQYSDVIHTVVSREKWQTATDAERDALIAGVVENYVPDQMGTDTGTAMRLAGEELSQESQDSGRISRRRLIVITDFQRGSKLDALKSGDWPDNVEVDLKVLEATQKGNAGISFVRDRRLDRTRIRVTSAGDSVQQEFQLQPFDVQGNNVGQPISVSVAPGQRRTILLPAADPESKATVSGIELTGDAQDFDNLIELPAVENPVVRVGHVGPLDVNDPESMRYYLQRVLDGNQERDVEVVDLVKEGGVLLTVPDDIRLVVCTAAVPAGLLESLTGLLDRSGTLMVAAPDVETVQSVADLLPSGLVVQEADVDEYAMLGQVDFAHPLFSMFSEARFSDFSGIQFWKHRNLDFPQEDSSKGDWNVIAKFDTGLPAIVESRSKESGSIILMAMGWHPTDSQLALSSRFPALVTRLLTLASPVSGNQIMQSTGDTIRPGELMASAAWTMILPDETTVTAGEVLKKIEKASGRTESEASQNALIAVPYRLREPGRYQITGIVDGEPTSVSLIASLSSAESRTERLPAGQLEAFGIGTRQQDVDASAESDADAIVNPGQKNATEIEKQQQWWRTCLLVGLALLIVESLWSSSIDRRRQQLEAAG